MSERTRNKSLQRRVAGFGVAVGLTAASIGLAGCTPSQSSHTNEVWISVTQSSTSGVAVDVTSGPSEESAGATPEQPTPTADWGVIGKWALAVGAFGGGIATYVAWIKHSNEERARKESAEYRARQEENLRNLRAKQVQDRQKTATTAPTKPAVATVAAQHTAKAPVQSATPLQSGITAVQSPNRGSGVVTVRGVPAEDAGIWEIMEKKRNPPPPVTKIETAQEAASRKQREQRIAQEQKKVREAEAAARDLIVKSFRQIQAHEIAIVGQDPVVNFASTKMSGDDNNFNLINGVWLISLSWGSPNPGEQRKRIIARVGSASDEPTGYERDERGHRWGIIDARRYVVVYGAKEVGWRCYIGQTKYQGIPQGYYLFPKKDDGGVYIAKEHVWSEPTSSFEEDLAQLFIDALKQPEVYHNPYTQEQIQEMDRRSEEARQRQAEEDRIRYDAAINDPSSPLYNTGTY